MSARSQDWARRYIELGRAGGGGIAFVGVHVVGPEPGRRKRIKGYHMDATIPYSTLAFDREELAQAMRETYDELIDFVTTPEFSFKASFEDEMDALAETERPAFVKRVLLNTEELKKAPIEAESPEAKHSGWASATSRRHPWQQWR